MKDCMLILWLGYRMVIDKTETRNDGMLGTSDQYLTG